MRLLSVTTIVLCAFTIGSAQADDVFPPDWRWEYESMWAVWDNWGNGPVSDPAPDGGVWIGLDDPEGYITYGTGHAAFHATYMDRSRVLELGADGDLMVWMDNYDTILRCLAVNVQITYHRPLPGGPFPKEFLMWRDTGLPPAGSPAVQTYIFPPEWTTGPDANGWVTEATEFECLIYGPTQEVFSIEFSDYPVYVDQIVIDTWARDLGAGQNPNARVFLTFDPEGYVHRVDQTMQTVDAYLVVDSVDMDSGITSLAVTCETSDSVWPLMVDTSVFHSSAMVYGAPDSDIGLVIWTNDDEWPPPCVHPDLSSEFILVARIPCLAQAPGWMTLDAHPVTRAVVITDCDELMNAPTILSNVGFSMDPPPVSGTSAVRAESWGRIKGMYR